MGGLPVGTCHPPVEALPDRQRARLWQAVVETVLLYNAETWTLTATLERQLDSAHSGLLRAAFQADESVGNDALYERAQLQRPSTILRRRWLQLAGHVIRAESYCAQLVQDVLLLTLQGPHWLAPGDTWTKLHLMRRKSARHCQRGGLCWH